MCGFDSVATESLSPFCGLFTKEEVGRLGYYLDLGKYYLTGYVSRSLLPTINAICYSFVLSMHRHGNPLGPVQGVGYVAELIARLTSSPVQNTTNINRTLDSSEETFPLHRTLYADFSHDNQMIPIYAALGIHRPLYHLPMDRKGKGFVVSELVPFSARLAVEKYVCIDDGEIGSKQEWVRVVNNDKVIPIPECDETRSEGELCELGAFLETLDYARSGAEENWERCHASPHKVNGVDLIKLVYFV